MCDLDTFKISLKDVEDDEKVFRFNLDNDYFEVIGGSEVKGGAVVATVTVRRTVGVYEIAAHCEGTVVVPCDLCLDDMEQPVGSDNRLIAKLGSEYREEDDLITVDQEDGTLDLGWLLYEFVALSVPTRHVHQAGQCNPEMTAILKQHEAGIATQTEQEREADPRWNELKKLKTIIKD